ncbi:MAG: polyprenyl diphosphate synthase, partial [Ignisphaera sp.]
NIAICYGGRQEILDAIKAIVKDAMLSKIDIDRLTEDILRNYLSTSHLPSPEPDLVIRTSGELRISNFLLWQIAYSELYFCDVYWPDFRKIDLYRAIRSYQSRERRYGR